MYCFILLSSNFIKHHDRACVSRSARTFLAPTCVGLSVANIIACNTSLVNILFTSYMFFVQSALVSKCKSVQSERKIAVFPVFRCIFDVLSLPSPFLSRRFLFGSAGVFRFMLPFSFADSHRLPPLSPLFRPDPAPLVHPNLFLDWNKFIFRKRHL